jgi:hypothetical protein
LLETINHELPTQKHRIMEHYSIIWRKFNPAAYEVFEDPIFGQIDRDSFLDSYGPLLITFDGRNVATFIDFYFESSPLNRSVLVFRDAPRRDRFLREAQRMELVPGFKELTTGESDVAVEQRKSRPPKVRDEAKMLIHSQQTLDKLTKKLAQEMDIERRRALQEKIQRITAFLATKHNTA